MYHIRKAFAVKCESGILMKIHRTQPRPVSGKRRFGSYYDIV